MDINELIREIKQSFRLMMDGAVSKSMRDKGLDYKLNWGATLPRLREKAEELKQLFQDSGSKFQDSGSRFQVYDLAIALWKEDVRECKILATMLMPPEGVLPGVIDIWMEQMPSQEIAEQAAFNLFQYLPYAPEKAYAWIATDKPLYQLCGFHVLTRLFMQQREPNARGINEFLDQAVAAMQGESLPVRKAAMASVMRFAELGLVYERLAKSALKQAYLDFL